MKKILLVLLFSIFLSAYGQQVLLQRRDSAGIIGFSNDISVPVLSKQELYNKTIGWFANRFPNAVGEVTISAGSQIRFSSSGQNDVVIPDKSHPYSVVYKLYILISDNQISFLVNDFVFFPQRTPGSSRKQKTTVLRSAQTTDSSSCFLRICYQIADSLADKHASTLSEIFKPVSGM